MTESPGRRLDPNEPTPEQKKFAESINTDFEIFDDSQMGRERNYIVSPSGFADSARSEAIDSIIENGGQLIKTGDPKIPGMTVSEKPLNIDIDIDGLSLVDKPSTQFQSTLNDRPLGKDDVLLYEKRKTPYELEQARKAKRAAEATEKPGFFKRILSGFRN